MAEPVQPQVRPTASGTANTPQTHSLADAAQRIGGVSHDWLARRLNRGEIPGVKLGRSWRMTDDDIAAVISIHHRSPVVAPNPWRITPRSTAARMRR